MGRTGLSRKELSRVEVMGRVKARSLRLRRSGRVAGVELSAGEADLGAVPGQKGRRRCSMATAGAFRTGPTQAKFRAAVLKQVQARYEDFGADAGGGASGER